MAVMEFLNGLGRLKFDNKIPKINELNETLKEIGSDFQLVPVKGIVSDDKFFEYLRVGKFPITAKYNTSKTNDMEWINSNKRLPANPNKGNYKLSDVVLVHVEYEPYNGNYHSTTAYYDYNDNKWKEIDGKWAELEVGTKVTYWMELPEPPKK